MSHTNLKKIINKYFIKKKNKFLMFIYKYNMKEKNVIKMNKFNKYILFVWVYYSMSV